MNAPLVHRVRRPRTPEARPPMLVLLHGVGSNEDDLFALEEAFGPEFLVVSPRAPLVQRPASYAWFPVRFTAEGPVIDPVQAESSRLVLKDFVGWAVEAYGTDPSRTILAGFSQGAIMAASLALTEPGLAAGVVMMSGRILAESAAYAAPPERRTGTRWLVIHGTFDDRLPLRHGRESVQTLRDLGADPEYRELPMGHEVTDQSLGLVRDWVDSRFS